MYPASPGDMLAAEVEEMPIWMSGHVDRIEPWSPEALRSRWTFYPGSGLNGTPIKALASVRACHFFVYVDLRTGLDEICDEVRERGLLGYDVLRAEPIRLPLPSMFPRQLAGESGEAHRRRREFVECWTGNHIPDEAAFFVFERSRSAPVNHGADRIALLFVRGEAVDFFSRACRLGQTAPYAMWLRPYMGYDFVRDASLWEVAKMHDALPRWVLGNLPSNETGRPWNEYSMAYASQAPKPVSRGWHHEDWLYWRMTQVRREQSS
jgi:hypothetical protein